MPATLPSQQNSSKDHLGWIQPRSSMSSSSRNDDSGAEGKTE